MTEEWRLNAQLAQMADRYGLIDTALPSPSGIWRPTTVRLSVVDDRQVLEFGVPEDHHKLAVKDWGWQHVKDAHQVLNQFLRIESAVQAERFATKFGSLYLCDTHKPVPFAYCFWRSGGTGRDCTWSGREPIEYWLRCAAQVRAAINIVALHYDKPPRNAQLESYRDLLQTGDSEHVYAEATAEACAANAAYGFMTVQFVTNYISLTLPWPRRIMLDEDTKPVIDVGLGFLPAVWYAVMLAVARTNAIYFCKHCRLPYVRPTKMRAPKDPDNTYCPECRQDNYRAPKSRAHAGRVQQFRDLFAHITRDHTGDWNQIRIAWNDAHPDVAYEKTERFVDDIGMAARGSYRALTAQEQRELKDAILTKR